MKYKMILEDKESLSKTILKDMYPNQPFTNKTREKKALKDIGWTLMYIVEGLNVDNIKIVENLLIWMKKLFKGLNIDPKHVDLLIETTKTVLHDTYSDETIDKFLEKIDLINLHEVDILLKNNPYEEQMNTYLDALLSSERNQAQAIIFKMMDQDVPVEDIYLYVFQETMRHVGILWQTGKIQVGREHYCTAVTQYLMSLMYSKIFSNPTHDKKILSCAVGSELHEIGIRMVADFFEMYGWDSNYLGANLPAEEIVNYALEFTPDVIALSITMPYHLSLLQETISTIRANKQLQQIKILVGGLPFLDNDDLYLKIGADGYAKDAKEGLTVANNLL